MKGELQSQILVTVQRDDVTNATGGHIVFILLLRMTSYSISH